ncbi:urease accessory protein UreD [Hoyosella rhizosphaerae]|nr:urease accessory protein UreD [Hoyosella rhizosphaerae]MBN4926741.1 urease accessory protein UreD [Hoyosella rhizosphaerae]
MRTDVTIEASVGRSPRIRASGGLAVRQTGPHTVYLVGTAITPLGGDHISVTVRVADGAQLCVRTVAASVALPGRSTQRSTAAWDFTVGAGGVLDFSPEPLIIAGTAEHEVTTSVICAPDASVSLREQVQIGRSGEVGLGVWRGETEARLDSGVPLLVHALHLGSDDALGSAGALESVFRFTDATRSNELSKIGIEGDPRDARVRLPLPHGAELETWMGSQLPTIRTH